MFIRKGFLQTSTDNASTTGITYAGRVFGRLGQGAANYPSDTSPVKPFYWGVSNSALHPGMMISIFPDADADAGLTSGKKIVLEGKSLAWEALTAFSAPAAKTVEADALKDPNGAAKLVSGLIGMAVVVASLA